MRVTTGRKPDGKLIRKTRTRKTHREAMAAKRDLEWLRDSQLIHASETLTLGQALDEWLRIVVEVQLKPQTVEGYRQYVQRHIKPSLGSLKLQAITPREIAHFEAEMRNKVTRAGKPYSGTTIRHAMTILSTALACFVSWQAIPSNPATLVKKPSISPTDIVIWDNNEMRGFLEAISDDWWAPKFVLAMTTGMRAGEVCGLSWQAVDLQNRALRVEKSMSCIRGTYDWSAPKSAASVRSIPLTNQAIAALQVARASDIATAEEWRFADLVFHRRNGMPLAPHNLSVNFRRVVERLGLPKIRLHDLRHSFASLLLRSGTDVSTVKDLMGHSTIRLTVDTYGHVLEDTKQAAMEKFDDSLAFS